MELHAPEKWNDIIQAGNSQPAIFVTESEDIISRASLSAFQENFKIFLVWLPEKLRPEAANKLLKIIEEPFDDTLFILVSNDDSRLLPTIFSRTQRFIMRPLDHAEISAHLRSHTGVDRQLADAASRIAEGSMAKAEELALHPDEIMEFASLFKETMRMAYALNAQSLKKISETVAAMGREKIIRFLSYCSRMTRENFIYNMAMPQISLMTPDEEQFSRRFARLSMKGTWRGWPTSWQGLRATSSETPTPKSYCLTSCCFSPNGSGHKNRPLSPYDIQTRLINLNKNS